MFHGLSPRCKILYNKLNNLPGYLMHLEASLKNLNEILEDYDAADLVYRKEYAFYNGQWRVIERAFYKALKRLAQNRS